MPCHPMWHEGCMYIRRRHDAEDDVAMPKGPCASWVDRWMDGWIDGWMDGWMDGDCIKCDCEGNDKKQESGGGGAKR